MDMNAGLISRSLVDRRCREQSITSESRNGWHTTINHLDVRDSVTEALGRRLYDRRDDPLHADDQLLSEHGIDSLEATVVSRSEGSPAGRVLELPESALDDLRQFFQRLAAVGSTWIDVAPGEVRVHISPKTSDSRSPAGLICRRLARDGQAEVVGYGPLVRVPAGVEVGEVHNDPRARGRPPNQPGVPEHEVDIPHVLALLSTGSASMSVRE